MGNFRSQKLILGRLLDPGWTWPHLTKIATPVKCLILLVPLAWLEHATPSLRMCGYHIHNESRSIMFYPLFGVAYVTARH